MAARRSARLQTVITTLNPSISTKPSLAESNGNDSRKRKSARAEPNGLEVHKETVAPSTPKRKRVLKESPPSTPSYDTRIALKDAAAASSNINNGKPNQPRNRIADPLATNATLISPETSRLITNKSIDDLSPTKAAVANTTTEKILQEACAHLVKVDPRLGSLVQKHYCRVFCPESLAEKIDPFENLCDSIISQQVSGAAAKSIRRKFVALFNPEPVEGEEESVQIYPTPSAVAPTKIEVLRTAGLSQRKAEYIKGLAEKFCSGELSAEMLFNASYDEVLEKLTAVRGLGKWSVEMFACFGLKRMDIFSVGDLGVQKGVGVLLGRNVEKLKSSKNGKWKYASEKDMLDMSEKFAPYRSVFMWYCWKAADVDVSTLEQ